MADGDVQRALRRGARTATLLRHGLSVRILHGTDALAILVLLVTGLALGEVLPGWVSAALGGHLAVNEAHRVLGVVLSAAFVLLSALAPRAVGGLLRDIVRFRRSEWRWGPLFLCHLARPARRAAPFHDGRFDPAQRVVFGALVLSLLVLCASGLYLFFSPPLPPSLMGPMIRIHIASAWVLIGALALHVLAGSGVVPTHRHLITAMFGDGRVSLPLAQTLWPGWASRQAPTRAREPLRHGPS